jgi:NNP family nitrate/nitrite transporter-like MFS transporter
LTGTDARTVTRTAQTRNLAMATWTFTIAFWAWNLVGPLGIRYTAQLGLSATQKSLLVATPVLVGAVGRIPVGALTDRYGGRAMFAVLSFASVAPVLLVAFAGNRGSYPLLLVFGFLLGIAAPRSRWASRSSTPGTSPPAGVTRRACSAPEWAARPCHRS